MKNISALTFIPPRTSPGGVRYYYDSIAPHIKECDLHYYSRGLSGNNRSYKHKVKRIAHFFQIIKFLLKQKPYELYVFNISLAFGGIIRDLFYLIIISLIKRKKIIIFFRGWSPETEKRINNSKMLKLFLRFTYFKAERLIVLSSAFRSTLIKWGYDRNIIIESTLVDESILNGSTEMNIMKKLSMINKYKILYLGNISKAKGVWEIVKSVEILNNGVKHGKVSLTIAGKGCEREAVEHYACEKGLNVSFPGYVRGERKRAFYKNAHIYVFASFHEGMPNSVLEAMAFGLPIITPRVGGILDFFEDGKMGLFLENHNPEHIAEKIRYLLDRPVLMKQMSEYNFNFAKKHFYASKVTKRLEKIIEDVVEGRSRDTVWWDVEYWRERIGESE